MKTELACGLFLLLATGCSQSATPNEEPADLEWANATPTQGASVRLRPETVSLSEELVQAQLLSLDEDGQTFTFSPQMPGIEQLSPGAVLIVGGIAIVRVTAVDTVAAGVQVTTAPAGLGEALESGHLEWDQTVDFTTGGSARFSAFAPRVGLQAFKLGLSAPQKTFHYDDDDYAVDATFSAQPGALDIALDVTKQLDCVELHLQGKGHIQRFRSTVSLDVSDGQVTRASIDATHLEGSVDLQWSADKPTTEDCSENKTLELPFGGKLPFIVGGLPMWIGVKSNVAFVVALTGKGAVAHGSAHLDFGGRQTFQAGASGAFDARFEPDRAEPSLGSDTETTSAEISGFSANLSMPRLELGAGLSAASAMVHFSLVTGDTSLTPGALGLKQCQQHTLSVVGNVGASAELFGHSFDTDEAEVFRKEIQRTIPAGIDCSP